MGIKLVDRTRCPICASESKTLYKLSYGHNQLNRFLNEFYGSRAKLKKLKDDNYKINQCLVCGILFQARVLNQEGQAVLYNEWVDQEQSLRKKQGAKAKLFRQYAGQMEIISRLFDKTPQQIEILEYGMGWGYWCRMANAFGYRAHGLELSPLRIAHARKLAVEVIEELPETGPRYDFIFSNQVFEHLDNPLDTLLELRDRLKPGGVIHIRVPDGRGVARHLQRNGWNANLDAIHPLEHINCFTRKTLIRMGKQAGLETMQPPARLDFSRLWGGIKREINDRWLTTHVYFKKSQVS